MKKRWVLITGSAKKLGAEIAKMLAKKGYDLILHYYSSSRQAEALARQCLEFSVSAETIQGDFSSISSTQEFLKRYHKRFFSTDCLINNVGNYLIKSALETSADEWEGLFQTNLTAPFLLSQSLAPLLIASKGAIINIGAAGIERRSAGIRSPIYNLTKSAHLLLTRTLAFELASNHVSVNMVSPGHLDFSVDLPTDLSRLPMGRPASTDEVTRAIAFLLEPENHYITGQNLEIAGGYSLI